MTSAITPELNAAPPMNASVSDRTPDNPSPVTQENAAQESGLTDRQKQNLMECMKRFTQKWAQNHRGNVKRVSKVFEYIRDRQYIYWDERNGCYVDPFLEANNGTQGGNDEWGFKTTHNVLQFVERVISNTLSPGLQKVAWQPADANSDEDVKGAEEAGHAQAHIERQNNINRFHRQRELYLFASGNYFRYSRFLRDKDRFDKSNEPIWAMENETVKPDRFICPNCGTETPADQLLMQQSPVCPACGYKLSNADYHEALTLPLPKQVGSNEVPNGGVAWSLYNTLHVMVSPDCNDPTVDILTATPMLRLDDEIDMSSLRASYPGAWDAGKKGSTGADTEYGRIHRTYNFSSTPGRNLLNDQRPTFTRCWLRDFAFNILDDKNDADELKAKFPDGVKLVCVGDIFLEAVAEKLTDHWTVCVARPGYGAYPPAIADPAMPIQDRINDNANNLDAYMSRLAVPDVMMNVDIVDPEAFNGASMIGGGFKPWKPKRTANGGAAIDTAFYQPQFHADSHIFSYHQMLELALQVIVGATPQTWGGSQDKIETASGQRQALNVATGVLKDYLSAMCEEDANAAKISVKCLAENSLDDITMTVQNDDDEAPGKKFLSRKIEIDKLKGNFNCYPDGEPGMPSSTEEIRERLTEMMTAAKQNPVIMEAFGPMKNRRLAMKVLGPAGMVTPGQDTWDAVMDDIGKLMEGEPIEGPDPNVPGATILMPSGKTGFVIPDKDLYDFDVAFQACQEWGLKNRSKVKEENPAAWSNFLLYLKLVAQGQAEKSVPAMPAPIPGAGAPQGEQA